MDTDRSTLLGALADASAGLLHVSESDAPWEVVDAPGAPTDLAAAARALAAAAPGAPLEETTPEHVLRNAVLDQPWYGPAEREAARRYRALLALLRARLPGLRAFRVGAVQVQLLLLAPGPGGGAVGLRTRAVET